MEHCEIDRATPIPQPSVQQSLMKSRTGYNETRDTWYYPPDIADDLRDIDIPDLTKAEILACTWEYARCVIPNYTNWDRYVAFLRISIITIFAEFRGDIVDIAASDNVFGYDVNSLLATLFEGNPGHEDMAREFRACVLMMGEKASERRHGEVFQRYVMALNQSPKQWFRMRDCDALARFTLIAALACNDINDVLFSEEQLQILCEIGLVLYDAVAFYKHRAEGETNSTFAYMPVDLRQQAFREGREILWALDAAWAHQPKKLVALSFLRCFGGPIHMMMRRYRFVEEDLTIGKPETSLTIAETVAHTKLWNRIPPVNDSLRSTERYNYLMDRRQEIMFSGLDHFLENAYHERCEHCLYPGTYGAKGPHKFGGNELCGDCQGTWRIYQEMLPQRAENTFPEILSARNLCTWNHGG